MKRDLIIDPEFEMLTVPLNKEQQEELEKSILEKGCLEPVIVWNGILVDGHKRYSFCTFEEINFETKELFFRSRDEVISWICRKRLREIPSGTIIYKFLSGKWYRSLRPKYNEMIKSGIIEAPLDNRGRIRTSKNMAEDLGVSYSAIENGEAYARNLEKIASSDPDIFEALMAGEIKASINEVRMLAQNDRRVRNAIKRRLYPEQDVRMREQIPRRKKEEDNGVPLSTGIKEMPAFDPDMEIRGLALTIPTWMSTIARAEQKTDMNLASERAKRQLTDSLIKLEEQIHKTLEVIECTEKEF